MFRENDGQLFCENMKYITQISYKSTEFVMAEQLAYTVTCVVYRLKDNFSTKYKAASVKHTDTTQVTSKVITTLINYS